LKSSGCRIGRRHQSGRAGSAQNNCVVGCGRRRCRGGLRPSAARPAEGCHVSRERRPDIGPNQASGQSPRFPRASASWRRSAPCGDRHDKSRVWHIAFLISHQFDNKRRKCSLEFTAPESMAIPLTVKIRSQPGRRVKTPQAPKPRERPSQIDPRSTGLRKLSLLKFRSEERFVLSVFNAASFLHSQDPQRS
jgi:hypothetical protein